uniref:SFRICE_021353 n=1 Tax=Spodoptera frugiperda TaxID=7108 RepID=A0A2H1VW03_SPOFR
MSQPYFAKCIIIVESTCTVYAGARLLQTGFLCFHIPVAGGRCGAARDSSRNADQTPPGMITSPGQRILLFLGNLVNFSLCSLKTLSLNLNFKPTWCSCTAVATVLRGAAQRPRRGAERYRPHLRVAPPSSERNTSARA